MRRWKIPCLLLLPLALLGCSESAKSKHAGTADAKVADTAKTPPTAAAATRPTTRTARAATRPATRPVDPKAILGDVREEHVMIPMRDGVHLSTWVYFPPGKGPFGVIYQQRYVDITSRGSRAECAKLATITKCVVALQNFRGSHESEGTFILYRSLGLSEHKDGYDTVEWLAKQPWSNGKVGTYGGSQGGTSQNFLAANQPPHLVAQYLTDYGVSLFHDAYREGGITRARRFLERNVIHARVREDGIAAMNDQLQHPAYDDWWKQEDTSYFFDKMNYPSVMLGGWFDPVNKGVIRGWHGREKFFPGRQWLVLGPWNHGGSYRGNGKVGDLEFPAVSVFDVRAHMAKFFGHYLYGEQNGVTDEPRVRYYVMGACGETDAPGHVWRTAREFPPADAKQTSFYFSAKGELASDAPADGESSSTYTSDPYHPNKVSGDSYPGAKDQRPYEQHGDVLTFTTSPLKKPTEWTGLVTAKLWVSSIAKDTDFIVRVTDVYPDGRSILLMDNIRRARFRDGFEQEKPLEPGKVYPMEFDVGYTSMIFNAGHRIRVTIGSTGDDWYEVNPQTGGAFGPDLPKEMVVAKNTIYHDRARPSQIAAPVRGE